MSSWILTEEMILPQAKLQYQLEDGRLLLCSSQVFIIYDISTGKNTRLFSNKGTTYCICQISDELVAFGLSGSILIYNIKTFRIKTEIKTPDIVKCILSSSNVLMCHIADKLYIYNDFKFENSSHINYTCKIAMLNDKRIIINSHSCGYDQLRIHSPNFDFEKKLETPAYTDRYNFASIKYLIPSNDYVFTVNTYDDIRKWSLKDGSVKTQSDTQVHINNLCILEDGYILTSNWFELKVWNLDLVCERSFKLGKSDRGGKNYVIENHIENVCVLQDGRISVIFSKGNTVIYSLSSV